MIRILNSRSRRITPAWVAAVVAVVMFGRALVPAGYMPSAVGGGPLVLCSGHAIGTLDTGGGTPDDSGGQHRDAPICPFAAAVLFGATPSFAGAAQFAIQLHLLTPHQSPARRSVLAGPPTHAVSACAASTSLLTTTV
jgi:hypothetical protein